MDTSVAGEGVATGVERSADWQPPDIKRTTTAAARLRVKPKDQRLTVD